MTRSSAFALALGGLLLLGADAKAIEVRYTTVGTFDSGDLAGTNIYADFAQGIEIEFVGALDDFVNTPIGVTTQTSFGNFDTSNTTRPANGGGNFGSVSSGFILDIFQTVPYEGDLQFVGSLHGRLHSEASQAWIQFDGPLVQTLTGMGIPIIYGIANADRPAGGSPTPGRVNIAPPSTNQGLTTLVGEITPIPEPSAVILFGMGAAAPLALTIRNRRKARADA
jgi:hypothetical protein